MRSRDSIGIGLTIVCVAGLLGVGGGLVAANIGHDGTPAGAPQTHQTSTAGSAPLYFADGVIYDGTHHVPYLPTFSANVAGVTRTTAGWLVYERIGQDGSQLVLVGRHGRTTEITASDPHSFDVAQSGNAVAVPQLPSGTIDLVDPSDGSVTSSVKTSLSVRQVRFGGNDLVFDATTNGGLRILRDDFTLDRFLPVHVTVQGTDVDLEDVSADGRYLVAGYESGGKSCIAVRDLTRSPRPLWSSCSYQPLGGTSIDPTGRRLIALPASWDGESPFLLRILDLRTGRPEGLVHVIHWTAATWVDPTNILVESATDSTDSAFTISECAVADGICHGLPGASTHHPANDAAAGWTY